MAMKSLAPLAALSLALACPGLAGAAPVRVRVISELSSRLDRLEPAANPSAGRAFGVLWDRDVAAPTDPASILAGRVLARALTAPESAKRLAGAIKRIAPFGRSREAARVAARLREAASRHADSPSALGVLKDLAAPLDRSLERRAAVFDGSLPAELNPLREALAQAPVSPAPAQSVRASGGAPLVLTAAQLERLEDARASPSVTMTLALRGGLRREESRRNFRAASSAVNDWVRRGRALDLGLILDVHALVRGRALDATDRSIALRRKPVEHWAENGKVTHVYPAHEELPLLLADFFAWYRAQKGRLPAVELAAGVYQRLIQIHPFLDGNGRTTRLVMDFVLQSRGLPPAAFGREISAEAVHPAAPALTDRVARAVRAAERLLARD